MELVVEIVGEILFALVLVGIAYAVGSVAFMLIRAARLSLRRLDPPPDVVDPEGRRWAVRLAVAPPPLRYRLSSWIFGARRSGKRGRPTDSTGATDPDTTIVRRDEIVHPSGLVEQFDEAAGVVVWVVLATVLVAIVVLLLEVLLVAAVALFVIVLRTLTSQWQCEVTAPDGQRFHVPAGSLFQARDERERLRNEIGAGVYRVPSQL